jgi:hypothetical protein
MAFEQFFPFGSNMSWEDWNGNFIMFYGEEPIPYHSEEDWKITAKSIVQLTTFEVFPVPDPELFENWQDWADQLTFIINGPST